MTVTKNVHAELMAARREKRARRAAAEAEIQGNEHSIDQFVALAGEIVQMTDAIRDAAEDHFGTHPDEIHWGHVGDASWTRDQPKHVLAVIQGEEGK